MHISVWSNVKWRKRTAILPFGYTIISLPYHIMPYHHMQWLVALHYHASNIMIVSIGYCWWRYYPASDSCVSLVTDNICCIIVLLYDWLIDWPREIWQFNQFLLPKCSSCISLLWYHITRIIPRYALPTIVHDIILALPMIALQWWYNAILYYHRFTAMGRQDFIGGWKELCGYSCRQQM